MVSSLRYRRRGYDPGLLVRYAQSRKVLDFDPYAGHVRSRTDCPQILHASTGVDGAKYHDGRRREHDPVYDSRRGVSLAMGSASNPTGIRPDQRFACCPSRTTSCGDCRQNIAPSRTPLDTTLVHPMDGDKPIIRSIQPPRISSRGGCIVINHNRMQNTRRNTATLICTTLNDIPG